MRARVIDAAYHRNGVGGEGFYVATVDVEEDGDRRRMLLTCFPQYSDPDREVLAAHQTRLAVIDLDVAAAGNIFMHPLPGRPGTGGNAWRGADQYSDLVPAIRDQVQADHDALMGLTRKTADLQDYGDDDHVHPGLLGHSSEPGV